MLSGLTPIDLRPEEHSLIEPSPDLSRACLMFVDVTTVYEGDLNGPFNEPTMFESPRLVLPGRIDRPKLVEEFGEQTMLHAGSSVLRTNQFRVFNDELGGFGFVFDEDGKVVARMSTWIPFGPGYSATPAMYVGEIPILTAFDPDQDNDVAWVEFSDNLEHFSDLIR